MVKDGLRGSGIGESLLNFLEGYLKKEKNSEFLLSSSMTDATKAQTVTVNNNSNAQGGSCTIKTKSLCPYKVGDEFPYNYTGGIQQFEASCPGKY